MTTAPPSVHTLHELSGRIVLVGAGKMGSAMLEGWLRLGLDPNKIAVVEPQPGAEIAALVTRGLSLNPTRAPDDVRLVVLAVKPQSAPEALPLVAPLVGAGTVVVSIMAGRTLRFLEHAIKGAVVRAMPNTPAAVGRGITVAVANRQVDAAQRALADAVLAAIGAVEWIEDESLMDAVTAVSGSGPAYVFLLTEALARAGVAAGLPQPLAATLARATVAGSGELLARSPLDPATLRQNVTSPGGTTAAALDVLMAADGLHPLLTKAIAAATHRSRELGA